MLNAGLGAIAREERDVVPRFERLGYDVPPVPPVPPSTRSFTIGAS